MKCVVTLHKSSIFVEFKMLICFDKMLKYYRIYFVAVGDVSGEVIPLAGITDDIRAGLGACTREG